MVVRRKSSAGLTVEKKFAKIPNAYKKCVEREKEAIPPLQRAVGGARLRGVRFETHPEAAARTPKGQ